MKSKALCFWTFFCLTAILLAIIYAPILFFGCDLFVSDHTFYFEPFARVIADGYLHGHLPLWNPYCYCGMPQLANPSPGIFYFPSLLYVGLSYSKAMGLILMLHHLVAFTGAFLLVESLGWGLPAAAFCGMLMALNGYMFSLSSNYTLPGTAAWGVLAIYGLVNIGRPNFARPAHKAGFVVLTALSAHWMIMCGRPEVFVPMMALLGATSVVINLGLISPFLVDGTAPGDEVPANWRLRLTNMGWQLGALVLSILLSCPSLVPVYEWSKLSPRATGISLVNVFKWSANWYDLVCMVCPQPLGDLQQPTSKYLSYVWSHKNHYPFLPSALIGPIAFSLMLLGLFDRTYKPRFYALCGLAVSLLLAMGKYGPLSELVLKVVPFLLVLRYPCKLLIVVILFAAVLGSRGLYAVAKGLVKPWQKKLLLGLWLLLLAVAGVLMGANQFCADHMGKLPAHMVYLIGHSLLISSTIGLFAALLITFAARIKLEPQPLALVLVLLTAASVFAPAMTHAPKMTAPGYYDRPQALATILDKYRNKEAGSQFGRLAVVYFDPLRVADGYAPRYPNQLGEPFMQYARELLIPNSFIDAKVHETFGYEASENKDFRDAFIKTLHKSSSDKKNVSDVELARFCLITGTKYLASQTENDSGDVNVFNAAHFKLLHEDVSMNVRLYEVLSTEPRAYFARSYRTIASQKEAVDEIFAPDTKGIGGTSCEFEKNALIELDEKTDINLDPLNFSDRSQGRARQALGGIEQPQPTFNKMAVVSIDPSKTATPEVGFLRDDPEHVAVSVNTPADGFLILNDRYYPGWHAVIDTQPAVMYRANAFMRAVYLAKGSHLIEFNYEPESLRNGLYLAAIAVFFISFLLAVYLRQPAAALVTYLSTGKAVQAPDSTDRVPDSTERVPDSAEMVPSSSQEQSAVLDLDDRPS